MLQILYKKCFIKGVIKFIKETISKSIKIYFQKLSGKRISNKESKETQNKKINLDKETFMKSTLKSNTNSDFTSQEIENFFKIFNVVMNQIQNERKLNSEDNDTEDGIKDILVTNGEKFFYNKILIRLICQTIKKALKTQM